ncbi:MAG TPA: hypothetical protein VGB91_15890 [Rhizomicrobium sp.]
MSNPRFSPITAALFARKGDAAPSDAKPSLAWTRAPVAPPVPPLPSAPPVAEEPPPPDARVHRMMLTLTPLEFEKLGIAAVKKGLTRHQVLKAALDVHLTRLKREFGGCGCMAMADPCREPCCDG